MNEALKGLTSEPFEVRHESTNAKFEILKQKLILLMAYLVEGEVATAAGSTRVSV